MQSQYWDSTCSKREGHQRQGNPMQIAATYSIFLSISRWFPPQVFASISLHHMAPLLRYEPLQFCGFMLVRLPQVQRCHRGFSAFSIVVPAHEKGRARIMSLKEGMDPARLSE